MDAYHYSRFAICRYSGISSHHAIRNMCPQTVVSTHGIFWDSAKIRNLSWTGGLAWNAMGPLFQKKNSDGCGITFTENGGNACHHFSNNPWRMTMERCSTLRGNVSRPANTNELFVRSFKWDRKMVDLTNGEWVPGIERKSSPIASISRICLSGVI